jgi:Ca2+-binding EF-hand superfamily protein
MDLNNDKYLDFREFSTILMGSMRADFRLRALFSFYIYDEGQKGLINNHPVMFFAFTKYQGNWEQKIYIAS